MSNDKVVTASDVTKAINVALAPVLEVINNLPTGGFGPQSIQMNELRKKGPSVEYSDPVVEACERAQISAIDSMPEGEIIVKGRKGSQHINRSQLKLDAIKNFLQDRNQFGAVRNIR